MQKLIIMVSLTLLIGLLYQSQQIDQQYNDFELFIRKYGKYYSSEQYLYRYQIYQSNAETIRKHNYDTQQTYKLGETKFMDLTQDEFVSIFLTSFSLQENKNNQIDNTNQNNFKAVDWRGITKVKDQGLCGSCWAFSAVGATESLYYNKKGISIELSEQQLVDCDKNNYGCDGGYHNLGLKYVMTSGLVSARDYSYVGKKQYCKIQGGPNKIDGVQSVSATNLQAAVQEYPVAVLVDATNWALYSSGVFGNCLQGVNHAVLLVGYQDDGTWIVKNSWGIGWGEQGHIRLYSGNTCGVSSYAYKAI